jgi:uncharacterized protein with PIN domain
MTESGRHAARPVVVLWFGPELRLFLRAPQRGGSATARADGTSTLGHVVQSLGVPLTEVGGLLVDGSAVDKTYRPAGGEVVTVRAADRPQSAPTAPPRFLLDVHLGTLARRLRVLGVDAAYRNAADDAELVAEANDHARVLLTQDRGLLMRRALRQGAYVRGARPDDQLADVIDRFGLEPRPFTRCTACNGALHPVAKEDVLELLEPGTRSNYDAFSRCSDCDRVYWRGAHATRLDEVVAAHTR